MNKHLKTFVSYLYLITSLFKKIKNNETFEVPLDSVISFTLIHDE